MTLKPNTIISPRGAMRVVDQPSWYNMELVSGVSPLVSKNYSKSAWANACLKIRGGELANLPWAIVRKGVILEDHPVRDMLLQFGQESNYIEGMEGTEIDLLNFGKGFWLRDADIIQRLDAPTIKVVYDSSGIKYFEQTIGGRVANKFARDEIVYFREYHPDNQLGPGVPVMDVIKSAVNIEYEAALYTEAFFKNDATPALLLSTEQTVQEGEMSKVMAWWDKTFRGSKKAHKTGFVDKGLKAFPVGSTMKEAMIVGIRDQARKDICAGARVPILLVGMMEQSTYANAQEARKFMLEDIIIPRSKFVEGVVNQDFVHRIDPTADFKFFPYELPILQEGASEKWTRLNEAREGGLLTDDFVRQQMGWPESAAPAEDMPLAGSNGNGKVPADEAALRQWRRKAMRAVKAGHSANVEFESDDIPERLQASIRAVLDTARTSDQVAAAFQ